MSNRKILIVSGPSGCGKSTVLNKLYEKLPNHFFSISATTRKPRPGEKHGVDYLYITHDEFKRMLENNELLEYTEYVGNFYGTPIKPIFEHADRGELVVLDVDVNGFEQISKKLPEAKSVFITPPSMEELEKRLRSRGTESEETIVKRLKQAEHELFYAESYDAIVVNDDVARAADEIYKIINA